MCLRQKLFSNPYSFQDVVVYVAVVGIGTQKKTELKPKSIEPKNLSPGAAAGWLVALTNFFCL